MAYEEYADYCIISHNGTQACLEVGEWHDGEVYLADDPEGRPTGLWVLVEVGNVEGKPDDKLFCIIDRERECALKSTTDFCVVHEAIDNIATVDDSFKWDINSISAKENMAYRIVNYKLREDSSHKFLGVKILTDKREQVCLVGATDTSSAWDILLENEGKEACLPVKKLSREANRCKNAATIQKHSSKNGTAFSSNAAVNSTGTKLPLSNNSDKAVQICKKKGSSPPKKAKSPGSSSTLAIPILSSSNAG